MKRTAIISLIIVFLTTQYTYALASCELCNELKSIEASELLNGIKKPEAEEVEEMFIELELGEDIDLIDNDNSYTFEFEDLEVTIVLLYNFNQYIIFFKKEGNLIGAVDLLDGEYNLILSQNIQPTDLCDVVCIIAFGALAVPLIGCVGIPIGVLMTLVGFSNYNFFFLGLAFILGGGLLCLLGFGGIAIISLCMSLC